MKINCSNCINEWELYGITGLCPGCDNGSRYEPVKRKRAPRKPLTNYDRLISKTPEELAAWIADHPVVSEYDENNPQHKAWLEWLKQEATDEK